MTAIRKLVGVVMAAAVVTALVAGCGAQTGSTSQTQPVQLVVEQPIFNPAPKDWQAVEDAVSKITLQKINATVKINLVDMGNYNQKLNLIMSSGQPADIVYVGTMPVNMFTSPASQGEFVAMDKLLDQYGQGIKKAVGSTFLKAGQLNGHQYAIPLVEGYFWQDGFMMRKDLVDKYHIDINSIKTPQDFGSALKTIKTDDPSVRPLAYGPEIEQMKWYDPLGDSIGVLPNWDNNLKVVDLYETPEYAKMCQLVHSWYLAGYIEPYGGGSTTNPNPMEEIESGKVFAMPGGILPGWLAQMKRSTGVDLVSVSFGQHHLTTFDVARDMYAIPIQCKHPEKAMQFLNLLYTNKDIVNLIDNGIEGKDYVKKSDNVIDYPSGVNPKDRYPGLGGSGMGNSFLSYVYTTSDPNLYQKEAAFNNSAIPSKAFGFQFNPKPVQTQYAAVKNVTAQFVSGLESGALDPATTLPKFIAGLKAAGIDQIIAAKQKQLDAWAQTQQ